MNRLIVFHTRLRQPAKTCEFSDINKEIKEHIILTCTSSSLRRRALREKPFARKPLKVGTSVGTQRKTSQTSGKNQLRCSQNQDHGKRSSFPAAKHKLLAVTFQSSHSPRNCHYTNKPTTAPEKCGNCGGYALIIGIHVQLVVNHAELVAKLVILLMSADQNLERWRM